MDDIFLRELVIFLAVLALFVGTVPMMIRGHHAQPVEDAAEAAAAKGGGSGTASRGMSKRRKARLRDSDKRG